MSIVAEFDRKLSIARNDWNRGPFQLLRGVLGADMSGRAAKYKEKAECNPIRTCSLQFRQRPRNFGLF